MPHALLLHTRRALSEPLAPASTSSCSSTSDSMSSDSTSTSSPSSKPASTPKPLSCSDIAFPSSTSASRSPSSSTNVVTAMTSISDVIVPGLGVTLRAALLLINDLCRRLLKRKHERIMQVSTRLADLFDHATAMETKRKFASSDWLVRFSDVVARFQVFMAACKEKNVLARLAGGAKEHTEVRAFEAQVDSLYKSMDFRERSDGSCCIQ